MVIGHAFQTLWFEAFTAKMVTSVTYVVGSCKLYSYLLQIVIMTAVLGCAVGHMIRQCCDCVVHGMEA